MLLGRRRRRTKSGGGCEGFLVVFLRVGIPEDPVLLFPDGDGLEVKRVTREQIRRAERSEIAVIDQRAGEACDGVSRRGAFSLMALAACRRPVDPDCRVVAPFGGGEAGGSWGGVNWVSAHGLSRPRTAASLFCPPSAASLQA